MNECMHACAYVCHDMGVCVCVHVNVWLAVGVHTDSFGHIGMP